LNVWGTIAEGRPSPRSEIVYNVEPYRAAVRQEDWKLVWRTMLPSKVELFNLAEDPYEKNNLAPANPGKVATLQQRVNELAQEAVRPLFLLEQMKVVMTNMQGQPVLPGEDGFDSGDLP
jgi:arylsulfatase A-like enzyme